MAGPQKEKEKSEAEKISEAQRKKMLQEQAQAQGPAIKNEPPPKQKSLEEVAKEVGKEAQNAAVLESKMDSLFDTKMGDVLGGSRPQSYPRVEQPIYDPRAAVQPPLKAKERFPALVRSMSALPLDFDETGIKDFPGLTPEQLKPIFDTYLSKNTAALGKLTEMQNAVMKQLANKHSEVFMPVDSMTLASGEQILIGSPINFKNDYTGVPIYIKQGDRTQLIMAYRSGSQGCWRRFAGTDYLRESEPLKVGKETVERAVLKPHAFKGTGAELGNEAWQNLDHRIQKRIDLVVKGRQPLDLTSQRITLFHLHGEGETQKLVLANEQALQVSMAQRAKTWDINNKDNMPDMSRVIAHWPAVGNPLYRNQINAIVESKNRMYRYGISLTPFGVFVQYVEDNTDRGVNRGGSPSIGVKLSKDSEWILTPVVEYEAQQDIKKPGKVKSHVPVSKRNRREVPDDLGDLFSDAPASQVLADEEHLVGKGRIVFDNLHTENSPFMAFSTSNRKLDGVYAALRDGNADAAQAAFADWMKLQEKF